MTDNPIDISSRVSSRLSALLKSRVGNPECEQPVTLMNEQENLLRVVWAR